MLTHTDEVQCAKSRMPSPSIFMGDIEVNYWKINAQETLWSISDRVERKIWFFFEYYLPEAIRKRSHDFCSQTKKMKNYNNYEFSATFFCFIKISLSRPQCSLRTWTSGKMPLRILWTTSKRILTYCREKENIFNVKLSIKIKVLYLRKSSAHTPFVNHSFRRSHFAISHNYYYFHSRKTTTRTNAE